MLGEFITRVKTHGLARPNKYEVNLFPPAAMGIGPREVAMMAESVDFPGQNIRAGTDTLRHGPQREVAQGMTYGPFSINFICTEGMMEKKFFESWQEFSVNKNSWEPRFYKDYVGRIILKSLNNAEEAGYEMQIYEAYPKTVNSQSFSYGSTGSYQTISVEITYRYWLSRVNNFANFSPKIQKTPEGKSAPMKWSNPSGNPSPTLNVTDRHPPAIDEVGVNTTPAVSNPADQTFLPSPGQPVSRSPHGSVGADGLDGTDGLDDGGW